MSGATGAHSPFLGYLGLFGGVIVVGCSVAGQQTKIIDFQDVSKIRKMVLRGCKMEKTEKRS